MFHFINKVKLVLNGTLAQMKPVFSGKLLLPRIHTSSTCIKQNLPAQEKRLVVWRSVTGRFQCNMTKSSWW